MSAPETKAATAGAAPSVRPPGQARALNLVSIGAIAASLGLVGVAAVPAWIKTSPTVVSVDDMPMPPNFRAEGLPPLPQHPSFVTDDDDGPELEGLPGEPHPRTRSRSRSTDRSLPPDLPPGLPGGPETMVEPLHKGERPQVVQVERGMTGRYGTTRRAAPLLAEPGDAAHILGQVHANERVVIVKEQGEWAFVFHGGIDSGAEMGTGWLKKSEIAIR